VVSSTPLRVSFAGGGTDLAAFYQQEHGAVFSTAINKYIYVTVKRHGGVQRAHPPELFRVSKFRISTD
jgi:D-glycero-alpha-D-manno-heptose-7-phosphate kinase